MRDTISASAVVQEFGHRKIEADKIETVAQGLLKTWLFGIDYVCELRLDTHAIVKQEGEWRITGGPYVNTYSPQEIADELSLELSRA